MDHRVFCVMVVGTGMVWYGMMFSLFYYHRQIKTKTNKQTKIDKKLSLVLVLSWNLLFVFGGRGNGILFIYMIDQIKESKVK
jgi:hypothetical protein